MANSGTVTAGSAALASQYNNLRDDVLNITTGHGHSGVGEDGKAIVSGGIIKYEEFTSSGSFVIPSNASSSAILVLDVVGAGAGGGGGNSRGAGTAAVTRCSGAGGARGTFFYLVSQFGTANGTVTVTIGAGGAGGTGTSLTAGTGGAGDAGGLTPFGTASFFGAQAELSITTPGVFNSFVPGVWFRDVTPNVPSGSATGTANFGTIGVGNVYYALGGFGSSGNQDTFRSGSDNSDGAAAGATGGGITSANVASEGGVGGKADLGARQQIPTVTGGTPQYTFGGGSGSAGTAEGGAGGSGTSGTGDGGGGGGASTTGNGGAGGAGSTPGGGGGSGGACRTGSTGGVGGAGGSGRVRVWVIG